MSDRPYRKRTKKPLTVQRLIVKLLAMPRGALVVVPGCGEGGNFTGNAENVRQLDVERADIYDLQYVEGPRRLGVVEIS